MESLFVLPLPLHLSTTTKYFLLVAQGKTDFVFDLVNSTQDSPQKVMPFTRKRTRNLESLSGNHPLLLSALHHQAMEQNSKINV